MGEKDVTPLVLLFWFLTELIDLYQVLLILTKRAWKYVRMFCANHHLRQRHRHPWHRHRRPHHSHRPGCHHLDHRL